MLIIAVLISTLPVSGAWSALPELPPLTGEWQAASADIERVSEIPIRPFDIGFLDVPAPRIGAELVELFFPPRDAQIEIKDLNEENLEDLETRLQDELLVEEERQRFWNRDRILIGSGILLLTGLVLGLVALLSGSGSGSGSSSSSGSSGNTGNNASPGGPLSEGLGGSGGPGEGGGIPPVGGGDGGFPLGGGRGSFPIPHNPEPSTFLLAGLGLLIPLLRKRRCPKR